MITVDICSVSVMERQWDPPVGLIYQLLYGNSGGTCFLHHRHSPIYCRYVDDTFIRINREEDLHILILRNAFITSSSLNFTCERSEGGELPLLDVKVEQVNNSFNTHVYVKPTNLGQCLSGDSEYPKKYKSSVINTFVRRALIHCASRKSTHQQFDRISQCLVNNGYSNHNISHSVKATIDWWYDEPSTTSLAESNIKLYYRSFMTTK